MRSVIASMLAVILATVAAAQTTPAPAPSKDLLQDVQLFETRMLDVDRAYTPAARAEAKKRLRALEARLDGAPLLDVQIELCRIAALADNGHTGCLSPPLARPVDIGFYPLDGGVYVFSAGPSGTDLLGGRLVAVDGRPIGEVKHAARTLFGGRPDWRDLNTVYAYSRPAVLHALGLAREDAAAVYRIRTPAGRIVERRLQVAEPGAQTMGILPPERTPWSWQDLGAHLRWRDAPAHGAIFVQLRTNADEPGHPIGAFLDEVERQRAALGRRTVILDLRSNGGGDLTLTREFLAAWPGKVGTEGRFIVLVGPRTFSAALADVAYLKQAGGRRVTLVGADPGDGLTFFAEGRPVQLPNVRLIVRPATERDDFKGGCRRYADCFAGLAQPGGPTATPAERAVFIKRMPVAVSSLDPEVSAPTAITDYLEGRDSGLAAALKVAQSCGHAADPAGCEAEIRSFAGPTSR